MNVTVRDIVTNLNGPELYGNPMNRVEGVTYDSRKVRPGWAFVAMPGANTNGHNYIESALSNGAAAIIAQTPPDRGTGDSSWVVVKDTRRALGIVASVLHGNPTDKLTLIGITGTNGKTTLTFLLEGILKAAGSVPGVVGTITYRWQVIERAALHTTPEASDLQSVFAEMVHANVSHGIMEVSSHGLHMGRLEGCNFDIGVFTNLSQDHLDYHETMEAYYQVKKLLFSKLLSQSSKNAPKAVVNLDDPYGQRLVEEIKSIPSIGYGLSVDHQIHPVDVTMNAAGINATLQTRSGSIHCMSKLTGSFNLMNMLAAVAVSEALQIPHEAVEQGIREVEVVSGRLERIDSRWGPIFVDYAHTPNALTNVLQALREVTNGRIITIMGCGGDRDKSKRPLMGKEAAAGSEFVVVTSDNPRSEDPIDIIDHVVEGVQAQGFTECTENSDHNQLRMGGYKVLPDRREAISWAVQNLRQGDILLVAGKGHETYQEIQGVRYPFDDRVVIREELKRRLEQSTEL